MNSKILYGTCICTCTLVKLLVQKCTLILKMLIDNQWKTINEWCSTIPHAVKKSVSFKCIPKISIPN